MLFHRHFQRFTGGHLKVWDYYNHVRSSGLYEPQIVFSPETVWDETNPWYRERAACHTSFDGLTPDCAFIAGLDWEAMAPLLQRMPGLPIINLVQSLWHVRPDHPRMQYLQRKAIRVCVSEDVRTAILASGAVNGPVHVIPNGMDQSKLPASLPDADRDIDLLIAASKHPGMGARLQRKLESASLRIRLLTSRLPRTEFHAILRRARTAVLLPQLQEGFFLPALEAMALSCLVVCPDCIGNRSWCLDGVNCFRPGYEFEAVLGAIHQALALDTARRRQLREAARVTVEDHDLVRERARFLELLEDVDHAWRSHAG